MTGAIQGVAGSAAATSYNFGTAGTGLFGTATTVRIAVSATGLYIFQTTGLSVTATGSLISAQTSDTSTSYTQALYVSSTSDPAFTFGKGRGSNASKAKIALGDHLGLLSWTPYTGAGNTLSAYVRADCIETGTVSNAASGARLLFATNPIGSVTTTEIARMDNENGLSMFGANPVIDANRVFRNRIFTVATLPTGVGGMRCFVSDALAPVWGSAVAAGGARQVPVYYDGALTQWTVG